MVVQSKSIDWNNNNNLCKATDKPPNEVIEILSYLPLILIFMSQFLLGISNTLYTTLGQTYLDDNNPKQRNTPLMLSLSSSMRMVGPIIGYGFAYLIMRIYIDPSKTPTITQTDPRWQGEWEKYIYNLNQLPRFLFQMLKRNQILFKILGAWLDHSWYNNVFLCCIGWIVPKIFAPKDAGIKQ